MMHELANSDGRFPSELNRRRFVGIAGAAAGLMAGVGCRASVTADEEQRVLQAGDRAVLPESAEAVIDKAYRLGHAYEKDHGGCARCAVAAVQDAVPFVGVDEGLFRGATCLDGGATPAGAQNCGAFTGAGMVIGFICGSRRIETFQGSAKLAHRLLHRVYDRFAENYGTVLCRDVQKAADGNCPEVVGQAARWVAEVLLDEFTDYQAPPLDSGKKDDCPS